MGEYQIIAMAAGMFFEFGIKDFIDILLVAFLFVLCLQIDESFGFYQSVHRYSCADSDVAGSNSGA